MQARSASIELTYQGINITKDVQPDLLSFTYTDNASSTADDISVEIKDSTGKWLDYWFPEKGDSIMATIKTNNWNGNNEEGSLYCGKFTIDEPEYAGPPRKLTLSAVSTPSNTNFTSTKKSRAWENIKFTDIANDIADSSGLDIFIDIPSDPVYDRKDQSETSDMSFLNTLCTDEGFGFKVTNNSIVIYNQATYEQKASILSLSIDDGKINSYSFKTTLTDSGYAACSVSYRNAKKGEVINYLYSIKDDLEDSDKIYEVNQVVGSLEEAMRLAESTLRSVNKKETTATLNVIGDLRYVGAICVDLNGFGAMSGKYFVDKAKHSIPNYNVDLELHKALEGY